MSIMESKTIKYDLSKLDYIVFLVNTDMINDLKDYATCSDKEFIEESMEQQYFYSLKDFQREFNTNELVSTFTDYIRIIPIKQVLEIIRGE
jgi:hypothetical protein